MAGGFGDLETTALRARHETLETRTLFHVNNPYLQFIDIGAVVMLGIGNGGFEHLANDFGAFLRAECQQIKRLVDGHSSYLIGNQAAFLGRQPDAAQHCRSSHSHVSWFPYFFGGDVEATTAFLSPVWPLKVRVSANSPSLCPTM